MCVSRVYCDAVSEDEREESEESTRDNERVMVKTEVTSDNEDESAEISEADITIASPISSKRTDEKLLTETETEEDGEDDDQDGDGDREGEEEENGENLDDLLSAAFENANSY